MKPLPVQLDHEALPAPHSIHEESLDDHVRLGLREAGLVDELQEGHLEIAPGDACAGPARLENRPDCSAARASRVAAKQMLERELVPEPQDLGLVHSLLELARPQDRGEVEQRAGTLVTGMRFFAPTSSFASDARWNAIPPRARR